MGVGFNSPNQHGEADPSGPQPLPKEVEEMLAEVAETKKMRLTVGQMEISIIMSNYFSFFLNGEISEHLDFTFGIFAISLLGEHGGTGFHVRFRSLNFSTGILRKKNIFNKKYLPENSNWHHAMGPRGRFRKRKKIPDLLL